MGKDPKRKYPYGNVIAATCFGIQAVGIGTYVSFGVLINPLIAEFGWSRASISGASSMCFLLMGFLGIIVGRLNDRFGPRILMTVSSIFFGLGYFLMSRLDAIWQLYLFFGVIFGIGLSTVDVISLSTIARWFIRRRGIVTGSVKVGTGAGQMIIPLLASILITRYGWRSSCVFIGVGVLIILVVIAQLLRRDPGKMGLFPDADTEITTEKADAGARGFTLREALHTRQFWTICASTLAIVYCLMTVMIHIVPYGVEMKVSATKAAVVLSTIGGVSMAGRFISGLAIDRIGSKRVILFSFILLITGLLWLLTANEVWMLFLFAVVYGVAHGAFFTGISPLIAEFFGLKSHGALFGIAMFCGTFGGSLGPVMAGYVFDVTGGYDLAFWICAVIAAIGMALMLLLRPAKEGPIGTG